MAAEVSLSLSEVKTEVGSSEASSVELGSLSGNLSRRKLPNYVFNP